MEKEKNVNQNVESVESQSSPANSVNHEEENKQLREKINELEAQLREIQNAARSIKAAFENYKMDTERQIKDISKNTAIRILKTLIPVVDDFKRAFNYYEKSQDLVEFYNGMKKIFDKFSKTLENEGLRTIDVSGKFDPFNHEAFEREERIDVEEYSILEVIEDGYMLNGYVVKPAKVKVAVKPRKIEKIEQNIEQEEKNRPEQSETE